jgi:hypothetical protein
MTSVDRQALVARLHRRADALERARQSAAGDRRTVLGSDAVLMRDAMLALLRADEVEPPATPAPSRPAGGAAPCHVCGGTMTDLSVVEPSESGSGGGMFCPRCGSRVGGGGGGR